MRGGVGEGDGGRNWVLGRSARGTMKEESRAAKEGRFRQRGRWHRVRRLKPPLRKMADKNVRPTIGRGGESMGWCGGGRGWYGRGVSPERVNFEYGKCRTTTAGR
jgi:hypothetical protein